MKIREGPLTNLSFGEKWSSLIAHVATWSRNLVILNLLPVALLSAALYMYIFILKQVV